MSPTRVQIGSRHAELLVEGFAFAPQVTESSNCTSPTGTSASRFRLERSPPFSLSSQGSKPATSIRRRVPADVRRLEKWCTELRAWLSRLLPARRPHRVPQARQPRVTSGRRIGDAVGSNAVHALVSVLQTVRGQVQQGTLAPGRLGRVLPETAIAAGCGRSTSLPSKWRSISRFGDECSWRHLRCFRCRHRYTGRP